jgi:uncharacterized membrane protein
LISPLSELTAMSKSAAKPATAFEPIRRAIFRGLAVILPPLLTIIVFIWAWSMIDSYILVPCERMAGHLIAWSIRDVRSGFPSGAATAIRTDVGSPAIVEYNHREYVQLGRGGKWIPREVWETVENDLGINNPPTTADAFYDRYVHVRYLRRTRTLPIFLAVFVLLLFLTGKFMAAGVGRYIRGVGEGAVHRMPIVRDVYSAAKQITESIFSEQEMQFLRVVAVEYPRKGLWQIAFVTGEGFKDVRDAAGEPIVSLLMSHSPVPATGFTCLALKRDTIELNVTVDQALQYIVSCGVVVPPHQQWTNGSQREIGDDITRRMQDATDKSQRLIESA